MDEGATKLDPILLKTVATGWRWFEEIKAGNSMQAIAEREGISQRRVAHLVDLAFLAPDIVTAIIEGRQPINFSVPGISFPVSSLVLPCSANFRSLFQDLGKSPVTPCNADLNPGHIWLKTQKSAPFPCKFPVKQRNHRKRTGKRAKERRSRQIRHIGHKETVSITTIPGKGPGIAGFRGII